LKRRKEFLRVAGTRRKWVTPGLILQIRPHLTGERVPGGPRKGENPPVRVGFTTSRKVGNAVARNRARRRLRAVAAEVLARHAKAGFDFVVIGRAATVTRPYAALVRDMTVALKKLDAYAHEADAQRADERAGKGR
jgi:ribonuclease P protein component